MNSTKFLQNQNSLFLVNVDYDTWFYISYVETNIRLITFVWILQHKKRELNTNCCFLSDKLRLRIVNFGFAKIWLSSCLLFLYLKHLCVGTVVLSDTTPPHYSWAPVCVHRESPRSWWHNGPGILAQDRLHWHRTTSVRETFSFINPSQVISIQK